MPGPCRGRLPDGDTRSYLDETVRLVEAEGRRCVAEVVDVRDLDAMCGFAERSKGILVPIDVAIANAGVSAITSVADTTATQWSTVVDINLDRHLQPHPAVAGGCVTGARPIVTVSSMMGARPTRASPVHRVPVGRHWRTKSTALELAHAGVTVNAVAPGNIRTPMIENEWFQQTTRPDLEAPTLDDLAGPLSSLHPMGVPWLEAEEVTGAVLYLLSDAARHVTGTVLDVNAGASGSFTA